MVKPVPLVRLLLVLTLLLGGFTAQAQSVSPHLALGNPSGATTDPAQPTNYLISRSQYAVGYHRDRGIPTWVAWHLQATDLGDTPRYSGPFISDSTLPTGWPRVTHDDYTGSGYDRGHMTPSADRTANATDNEATFILTNVLPQAPASNQGMWAQLEEYARTLVAQGNELYIVAGGSGSLGTLAGGKLTIPAAVWKVMLVLPAADGDDATRVTTQTTVIAIWSPNDATTQGQTWQHYQTTVACVQQRTGLDFFAAVEDTVEATIEGAGCPATQDSRVYLPLVTNGNPPANLPAQVSIQEIMSNPVGDDLQGEYVLLTNSGGSAADLTGWTLRDAANNTYTFPPFSLAVGAQVRIWTKAGTDDATNLYWGRTQPVWNNTGDTGILVNATGTEVARRSY